MREQFLSRVFLALVSPRVILAALALFYFVLIPKAYTALGLCLYNWSEIWYYSFVTLVAALALSLRKWWGYLGSIALSAYVAAGPLVFALKSFGLLPVTREEAAWLSPEAFFNSERLLETFYIPLALSALIFLHGLISLAAMIFRKRAPLP